MNIFSQESLLVTVAFVFRERLSPTLESLRHLIAHTSYPHHMICVDSGSPPEIADELRQIAKKHRITLIRSDAYLTPNESRNLALQKVDTRYVVFVDNDVMVGENWLEPLVRCAEETGAWLVGPLYLESFRGQTRIHMFGGEVHNRDKDDKPVYYERHYLQKSEIDSNREKLVRSKTGLIEFHAVLMNMDAYRQIGPLDPLLYCHSEHADISMAVTAAGKEIYIEPASVITYVIPDRLEDMDRDYFSLRWCIAWSDASVARLANKYNVPLEDSGLQNIKKFCYRHRKAVVAGYPGIRRIFGSYLHRKFIRHIGRPLEKRQSLRQYPGKQYVTERQVIADVVNTKSQE